MSILTRLARLDDRVIPRQPGGPTERQRLRFLIAVQVISLVGAFGAAFNSLFLAIVTPGIVMTIGELVRRLPPREVDS